jgi:hypothetical protein
MNEIPNAVWVGVAMAIAHMVLCHLLLRRVKRENMAAFEEMGAFDLFGNNTPRSTWLFWKWLCSSAPNGFSTGTLVLAWITRLLTALFLCWFAFQVQLIFLG